MLTALLAILPLLSANAQSSKEVLDSIKSARKTGNVKSMVTSVKGALKSKSVDAKKVVGNWAYVRPEVVSTSDNMMTKTTEGTWMADGPNLLFASDNVQVAKMFSIMEHNDTLSLVVNTSLMLREIQEHGGISDSQANKGLIKLSKQIKNLKSGFVLARQKK